MRTLIARTLMALLPLSLPAGAAELVMFEQRGCVWCDRFDREVAQAYDKTPEGRRAPLRRVDIHQPLPADLAFLTRERLAPVFVLVDQGREIGRIRGYPGDSFFWAMLAGLIEKLDDGQLAAKPNGAANPAGAGSTR